jgi:hypothetical protein
LEDAVDEAKKLEKMGSPICFNSCMLREEKWEVLAYVMTDRSQT